MDLPRIFVRDWMLYFFFQGWACEVSSADSTGWLALSKTALALESHLAQSQALPRATNI